jgi:FtsH-binding integral membrane protein
VAFIRRTYLHLAGAVAVFALIEAALLTLVPTQTMDGIMELMVASRWGWLIVLGGFLVVSFIANSWARSATSLAMQYAGLSLYVVAEAVIFLPLLYIAHHHFAGAIFSAALITGVVFGGLTAVVFITRVDFSFLRMVLWLGGLAAMGFILAAIVFQLPMMGVIFTTAMIVLACGFILYDTSNVLHHYRTDQHVAAALALFASVALLFWYILRLFMSRR